MKKELLEKIAKLTPLQRERLELEIENSILRMSENEEFAARQAKEAELQMKEKQAQEEREAKAKEMTAINTAVSAAAKASHLDLTKTEDYDRAWKLARQQRPELFPSRGPR